MTEPVDDLVRFGGVISTSVVPSVLLLQISCDVPAGSTARLLPSS